MILTGCGVTAPVAEPAAPQLVEPTSESRVVPDGAVGVTERVIDGDSLELTIDGASVEVRLLGINAPELRSSDGDDTCAGSSAREQLESSIDAAVTVAFVPDQLDRFGRRLGVLVLDDRPVTETMVEAGWALGLWSGENEALSDLMIEAADDRRGMWGSACGEPATADLVISDVRADAPGDDRENLTEEWVTVTNDGVGPFDLDGWIIRDETTSNRFTIAELVLEAGASVRFRSGRAARAAAITSLARRSPCGRTRGETVLLVDPDGVIASHAFVLPVHPSPATRESRVAWWHTDQL